jgi:hypothetical protein
MFPEAREQNGFGESVSPEYNFQETTFPCFRVMVSKDLMKLLVI